MWPGCDPGPMQQFWQSARNDPGKRFVIDAERGEDLMKLAGALKAYPQFERGINYLEELAGRRTRLWDGVPRLPFLEAGEFSRPALGETTLPESRARPPPHELQVRFRRGAGRGR